MRNKVAFPIDVDTRKYKIALKIYGREALPKAVAETLNRTAEAVTKQQIKNVKRDLNVRTNFTIWSMRRKSAKPYLAINKATGNNLNRMFSRAGTFSKYLWMQEGNFTKKGLKDHVAIPTLSTRVGKNIKKTVRETYRLKRTQSLSDGGVGFTNRKGKQTGSGFIGVPKGMSRRGMYLRQGKSLVMLRNLEHKDVKIKGVGFHSKAVKKYGTEQFIKAQFFKVSKRILKRKGLQ